MTAVERAVTRRVKPRVHRQPHLVKPADMPVLRFPQRFLREAELQQTVGDKHLADHIRQVRPLRPAQ